MSPNQGHYRCGLFKAFVGNLYSVLAKGIPMKFYSRWSCGPCLLFTAATLGVTLPRLVHAQTWVDSRQGPALTEILTIDATGENYWLWGSEDVANNGLAVFPVAEQAIDARTAYVATDSARFYSRIYFSVAGAAPEEVTTYVFLDTDRNTATGGPATGGELDASFTDDPTEGGYEYVIRVQHTSSGAAEGAILQFSNTSRRFESVNALPIQLTAETGSFLDPIRINQNAHGYLQSVVDLNLINLTQACQAGIFVRTTNQTQGLGVGDLVVGSKMDCTPTTGGNPDIIANPPDRCTNSDQCPNGGICVNGGCLLSAACIIDANCANAQACLDGRCVYRGGDACNDNTDCNGLVCNRGQCVACTDNNQCGTGMTCGPDGSCITEPSGTSTSATSDAGLSLLPGERLQGGACACNAVGSRGGGWLGLAGLLGLVFSVLLARKLMRGER